MIFKGVYEKFQQDMGRLGPLSRFLFVVVVLVPFPAWAYPVYEVSNRVYATIMHPDQPYQTAKIISNSDKEKGLITRRLRERRYIGDPVNNVDDETHVDNLVKLSKRSMDDNRHNISYIKKRTDDLHRKVLLQMRLQRNQSNESST